MLIGGCSQAPPPAPPDTRAADEKSIRDGEVAWNADWAAKDVDKIASHYGGDAILMVPGMPSMKGKDAIRTALKEFIADPNMSLTFTSASAEVAKSGDIAYTQGFFTIVQSDMKTKKPVTEKGAYITLRCTRSRPTGRGRRCRILTLQKDPPRLWLPPKKAEAYSTR